MIEKVKKKEKVKKDTIHLTQNTDVFIIALMVVVC